MKSNKKLAKKASIDHNSPERNEKSLREEVKESGYADARRKIKESFGHVNALPAIEEIQEIAGQTEAPKADRQQALMSVYNALVASMEDLEKVELPDIKWEDRPMSQRRADPFQWIKENYPSYGIGLDQGHIFAHDRPLYKRIHALKPWPDGFDLPSRAEANDIFVAEMGSVPTLKEISDAAPPPIKKMIKMHELHRSRKRNNAKR